MSAAAPRNAAAPRSAAAPVRRGVRVGPVGLAWRPRVLGYTVAALALAVVLVVLGVAVGSTWIAPGTVVRALSAPRTARRASSSRRSDCPGVDGRARRLVLGVAGALTQTVTRNPLGTPDIIGVTSGASVGAVAAIVLGGGSYSVSSVVTSGGIPVAATIGALVAAAAVYGFGWRGGVQSYRLVLVGIGVSATLDAMTSYLLVRAKITVATAASQWLVGSLSSTSWSSVWPLLVVAAVAVPLALATSAALGIGQLGDEVATGVGLGVQRHRLLVVALAVVLTAAAVAAAGPVGFVAFVVPQVALRLAGTNRPPLLLAGALGAVLVLGADLLARSAFPWQVPVGIVTTVVGAPYLIWLLVRHRKEMSR